MRRVAVFAALAACAGCAADPAGAYSVDEVGFRLGRSRVWSHERLEVVLCAEGGYTEGNDLLEIHVDALPATYLLR